MDESKVRYMICDELREAVAPYLNKLSVSYTHLDVYKRQAILGSPFQRVASRFSISLHTFGKHPKITVHFCFPIHRPVSYTHLILPCSPEWRR